MRIVGPDCYRITCKPTEYSITCANGTPHFSAMSRSRFPKLYVVSAERLPVYVGITKQPMRNRLRYGWSANGKSGYYGYRWRHHLEDGELNVWCHEDAPENSLRDLETVEAELVFLIRQRGQWPKYQTEIHFHPSTSEHRGVAAAMLAHLLGPM